MNLKSAPPRGRSEAKTSASVAAAWDKNRRHARARDAPIPRRAVSQQRSDRRREVLGRARPHNKLLTAGAKPRALGTLASPPLYRPPPPGAPQDSIDIIMMAPGPLDALPALLDIVANDERAAELSRLGHGGR